MAGQRKKRTTKEFATGDELADAIYEWWKDQEGPHNIPVMVNISASVKLAKLLREKGFIKETK